MARTSLIARMEPAQDGSAHQTQSSTTPSLQEQPTAIRRYPGLGLPVRHYDQDKYHLYPIGAHGSNHGSDTDLIFVRELAMMDVMEKLTDKPDWHKKIFDQEIVARWRKEALAIPDEAFWQLAIGGKMQSWDWGSEQPNLRDDSFSAPMPKGILSENSFDCCVQELRSKARYYEQTGIIPTLDACASVAKSDRLVDKELHEALRQAFEQLKAEHAASPDWHPRSNDMVQDLVHPSMYPLVYGRSRVFKEECVGVNDAIAKWAGTGTVIDKDSWEWDDQRDRFSYGVGSGEVPPNYWSNTYQWLPANVSFRDDGGVKFTSYINNLHPNKYPDVYQTIEKLIEASLPMWDQCLVMATGYNKMDGAGRTTTRMGAPDFPSDSNGENWTPDNADGCADEEVSEEDLENEGYEPGIYEDGEEEAEFLKECKWKVLRKPILPEPSFGDTVYAPAEGKRLIDRFRESGLQIIVKLASIELTPDKQEFPVGGWHIEGQMNENICGTALYYLDSENITTSNLSFRMQTSAYLSDDWPYNSIGQDEYHWMESIYGTSLGQRNSPCLQNYGSVETCQGRLLAFPNVLQHRVSPFKLIDPTKPGHRRFIALWLVDPTKRIISTANVPPQQMTWYTDSLLGGTPETRKATLSKLPAEIVTLLQEKSLASCGTGGHVDLGENARLPEELMNMVREYFEANADGISMSVEEAKEHRTKLMQERSAFQQTAEQGWRQHAYSFCEH